MLVVKAAIKAQTAASCWKWKGNYSRKYLLFSVFCHVPCPKKSAGLHYTHVSYSYKYSSAPSCRLLRLFGDFFFSLLNFSAENKKSTVFQPSAVTGFSLKMSLGMIESSTSILFFFVGSSWTSMCVILNRNVFLN